MTMRTSSRGAVLLFAAGFLFAAQVRAAGATIYRCLAAGGSVTYQEVPCPAAASGGAVDIPTSFPNANVAERERLFQREAALDARLVKRAEIDAAERIARDDRLARELTLQAQWERERARDTPVYVLARPLHLLRHAPRRPWPIAIR